MKFTESMLEVYSQPLSATEDEKCKNVISMIRDALKALSFTDDNRTILPMYSETLSYAIELRSISGLRKIKIFIQGSYANNTNVRTESDVDIAIVDESIIKTEFRQDQKNSNYGFTADNTIPKQFKDEIQAALINKFGNDVERGDKSIKIHGNTYRKDADTVPCRRLRDYRNDYRFDISNYIGGIVIYPDSGGEIINYPEQHISNGQQKNKKTNGYYKKMVRIIKKMRYLMEDKNIQSASNVSSFMLESMLWNIKDTWYIENCSNSRKVYAFDLLIINLRANTMNFTSWYEANGIKPLCANTSAFINLRKFVDDLSDFYEYE